MKRRVVFVGLCLCAVVAIGLIVRVGEERKPASLAIENANIQRLLSIPLVKGIEKPEARESKEASQMIQIFDGFADRNRNADGSLNRGTHAKGKCFNGYLEVFPADTLATRFGLSEPIISRLKRGLWSYDGRLSTVIRFANANGTGKIQPDSVPDVRGFSFSVAGPQALNTYVPGGRQDFMMNSTAQFATGGIHEFYELVKAVNVLVYKDFSFLPNPLYAQAIFQDLKLISQGNQDGGKLKSYAHLNYWANLPYTHGLDGSGVPLEVVKYKATPCDGKGKVELASTEALADDYLQQEISTAAHAGDICMLIQVQFMDLQALKKTASSSQKNWTATDWVENGGLLWDEKEMPFYTVGRVFVEKENPSVEISCEDQYINTRLHSNPDNQPIGSIARVRTLVEENSRVRRMTK